MSQSEVHLSEPRAAEGPEMIESMRRGVVVALREHKRIGNPVVVWDRESDRAVEVRPEDIIVPEVEVANGEVAPPPANS